MISVQHCFQQSERVYNTTCVVQDTNLTGHMLVSVMPTNCYA